MKGKRRKGTVMYEERGLVKDKRHYLSGKNTEDKGEIQKWKTKGMDKHCRQGVREVGEHGKG